SVDTSFIVPEPECFWFDSVRFGTGGNYGTYQLDSQEGPQASVKDYPEGNMGHRPSVKGGYFTSPPVDEGRLVRAAAGGQRERPARRDAIDHGRDGRGGREASPRGRPEPAR